MLTWSGWRRRFMAQRQPHEMSRKDGLTIKRSGTNCKRTRTPFIADTHGPPSRRLGPRHDPLDVPAAAEGVSGVKFAYADPPYLGLAAKFYGKLHPDAADYDKPETHQRLIDRLSDEYPDGWAMSLHTKVMRVILPMCPEDCRIMAWVKPFCSFKPGVGVAYAWEPIVVRGGRRRTRKQQTVRDYCICNIALQKGLAGAKPAGLIHWLMDVLGVQEGDTVDDIFPGSGAVGRAVAEYFAMSGTQLTMDGTP